VSPCGTFNRQLRERVVNICPRPTRILASDHGKATVRFIRRFPLEIFP